MTTRTAFLVAAVVGSVGLSLNAAAEKFEKLSGAQIRAKLAGMLFTDEVHWGEAYWPDGKLTSDAMGRKRVGRWDVKRDQLCTDYGKDSSETACYEVWISGRNMQLRMPGSASLPFEGVLERAPNRR